MVGKPAPTPGFSEDDTPSRLHMRHSQGPQLAIASETMPCRFNEARECGFGVADTDQAEGYRRPGGEWQAFAPPRPVATLVGPDVELPSELAEHAAFLACGQGDFVPTMTPVPDVHQGIEDTAQGLDVGLYRALWTRLTTQTHRPDKFPTACRLCRELAVAWLEKNSD